MIEGPEVVSRFPGGGVVAANPSPAARIGVQILEAGGNAFDAAVAASMACCMLRPNQTGVGGYVCASVVRDGRTGKVWSIDANGIAPAAAHERMFEVLPAGDGAGDNWLNELEFRCSVKDQANVYGPLSISAPGMMAGMGIIHERWGRLAWAKIVEPSLELLAQGFPYEEVADAIKLRELVLRSFPASLAHLMPEGQVPAREAIWHRPDMEKTLARVASGGWRDFYDGQIGRQIADHVQELGGILTRQDMANYQPRVTDPYTTTYHGAKIHVAVLTNGGISSLQTLNMLERLALPGDDSPMYWHLLAEVLKLVWRDRLNYLADPRHSGGADVPVERLLSKDYAAGRVETIRQFPRQVDTLVPPPEYDPPNGTLHVSAADAEGNLAAMTISQGMGFGSCVTVPGTGIILGHGMCRLDPRPERANSIAPGKQPLNNTSAMIVETPRTGRKVAIGMPGGRTIISIMPRAAQLLVDRDWTTLQTTTATRMHIEMNEPLQFIDGAVTEETLQQLRAMGHQIKLTPTLGGVMNGAEFLAGEGLTRAGSGAMVAGV